MNKSKSLQLRRLASATTLALGTLGAGSALASVCPIITDTLGFGGDCNVVFTINANGTVTTTNPNGTPYDGSDDNYLAIINNTSQTLNHFFITGPAVPKYGGIFGGMDGDGICQTSRFSGVNCTGAPQNTQFDYAPAGVTFTVVTANSGFVDFAGGLAPGAIGIFSLEEPASTGSIVIKVPEPGTLSLLGLALAALGLGRRRKVQ